MMVEKLDQRSNDLIRRKIAQLLVVRASGHEADSEREYPEWELSNFELQRLLAKGVGGVILVGGNAFELQHRCRSLQQWSSSPKELLLCADVEEGIGQRFSGGTWLLPQMALARIFSKDPKKALLLAERYGKCIGSQARKCGLNWVLAPVCDVNNNPSNPVINVRSLGEHPTTVATLACAVQRGLAAEKVLSCAKHFPGHGDTELDSHLDLPVLNHELERLKSCELIPFIEIMKAGVDAVMTGHLVLKKLDEKYPSTLSKVVLKNLLRDQLKFDRLIVTDALIMQAISNSYGSSEAAVLAFEAGADLILMPENAEEAIDAIFQALQSGRLPIERLEHSIRRRKEALRKRKVNLPEKISTSYAVYTETLQSEDDRALVHEIAKASLEARHRNSLDGKADGLNLIRVDSLMSSNILDKYSPAILLPERFGYKTFISHRLGILPWLDESDSPLDLQRFGKKPFLLQLFFRGNPFAGNNYLYEPWKLIIKQLQDSGLLDALIVYGSPYIWEDFLSILDPSIPTAYSPGQVPEAQYIALRTLFKVDKHKEQFSFRGFDAFTD
ncbi:glycoside hydrolase family 3 N-terminal domain-containing protein [Prochlorococcus sp. MIT 1300]|uniref:glycoside hydrolase family 3 N-terminal domain-containing protein n=1 Tax=Prochlorococcus sp. MIT 1300 TaxID=3096218 RepID=UPI002A757EA8|nr:glycoside hydrolase family 3 N-terminal domain-containing protein [Prochlorococcus sp. MIT 1300]